MHVLIIDDHAIFREGLSALLARADAHVEVSEAGSLAQAREVLATLKRPIDLVLLDLNLGDTSSDCVVAQAVPMFAGVPVGVLSGVSRLSPRQLDILRLLVYGLSNREIAEHLEISEGTVKTHMGHIFPALGVHSRAEAVYLLAQVEQSISGHGPARQER